MASKFHLLHITLLIYCSLNYSRAAPSNQSENSIKRNYKKWSAEEEEKLIFFDVLTDDRGGSQFKRIRAMWHNAYPDSNVTERSLYKKLHKLRQESQEEGEWRKYFKWNQEREKELLDVYHTTKPYKTDAESSIEEEWRRRHAECSISHKTLLYNVWRILNKRRKKVENLGEGTSNANLEWDIQHDSDLCHAHKIARFEGEAPWSSVHQVWSDLYPQYSHITHDQLRERVTYLKKNPTYAYFPWTEEENRELLDIYDKTMPDEENQGQRIHDIWSKIHPRYKFMTPYYLQVHASTLAHEREIQGMGNSTKIKWTVGEKADLMELYFRYLKERPWEYGFHKEWVRKHPRLAHLSNTYLKKYARVLKFRGFDAVLRNLGEGTLHREDKKSGPQKGKEMHGNCGETSSKHCGHSKQLMEGYEEEPNARTSTKFRSLKKSGRRWTEGNPKKSSGKAKVVYNSDEQELIHSNMSEDLE